MQFALKWIFEFQNLKFKIESISPVKAFAKDDRMSERGHLKKLRFKERTFDRKHSHYVC